MIDWTELTEKFDAIRLQLKDLTRDKLIISRQFSLIQRQRKVSKHEYKTSVSNAVAFKNEIHKIAARIKKHRQEWSDLGPKFNDDNLFLNVEACKDLTRFEELKVTKVDVIFKIPKEKSMIYMKKVRQCNTMTSQIKALTSQIRELQRNLSDLEIVWLLDDHVLLDNTHAYSEYCQMSRYQLSIKKKKKYLTHSKQYCKKEDVWYLLSGGEISTVCSKEEVYFIEHSINESNSKQV